MKIEHWHSQSAFPQEQLVYSNLLGACLGTTCVRGKDGTASQVRHCDTYKGEQSLSRNPASKADRVDDVVRFDGDGTIRSTDPQFDAELTTVLNLNLSVLMANRQQTLRAFTKLLGKGTLSRSRFEALLADWNGDSHKGELRPYCQIIVHWLRKKLSQASR